MKNIKNVESSVLTEKLEKEAGRVFGKINTREVQQITREIIRRVNYNHLTKEDAAVVVDYINRVHAWAGIKKRYYIS